MIHISNIGAFIKALKQHVPQALSGSSAVNATGIDRTGYHSATIAACTGATTGTPDSFSLAIKVQDSADNSTFADYKPDGTNVASTTLTAASTLGELDVDLRNARKYVRVVVTPTFTGGTSPTVLFDSHIIFGGATELPAS